MRTWAVIFTLPSVLEERYLIEEGGLAKFQKRYNLIRGGSDQPKMLQEGGLMCFTVF